MSMLAQAVCCVYRDGFSIIPMGDDKKPLVKWKEYQDRKPTFEEIAAWPPTCNLAIVTGAVSGLVVVDCESREDAEWFYRSRGKSPCVVQTRRGFHLYFRHPGQPVKNAQRVENRYDVRGDGGYVLAPPSKFEGGEYTWKLPFLGHKLLPVFDMAWRPVHQTEESVERAISDGVAYISTIRAVAGQRGHDDTWRAACALHDSGLRECEALLALLEWNRSNAEPPWSEKEILHKIKSAYGN